MLSPGVSNEAFSLKIEKFNLALQNGKTYTVSLDTKANDARKIRLNIGKGLEADPWFISDMSTQRVSLSNEMAI